MTQPLVRFSDVLLLEMTAIVEGLMVNTLALCILAEIQTDLH